MYKYSVNATKQFSYTCAARYIVYIYITTHVPPPTHPLRDACEKLWGEELKELVMERGKRGAGPLVVRPDSGDPSTVVVKVLETLGSKFGTTLNSKGYKMLPPYLRVMQVCAATASIIYTCKFLHSLYI